MKLHGSYLLKLYNGSISTLLCNIYNEYEWLPWKFSSAPKNYWLDRKNQRKFMDWARKELGIKDMDDWHNIKNQVFLIF